MIINGDHVVVPEPSVSGIEIDVGRSGQGYNGIAGGQHCTRRTQSSVATRCRHQSS